VEVTGRVVGSDYPDIGLANAELTFSGMGVHEGITDENGYFNINTLYASNTYQLVIITEGYEIFIGEAVIGATDTDLGDIIVNEIAIAPYDLIATVNQTDTEAELIWHSPSGGAANFWDFEQDDGEFTANSGWAWGTDSMAGAYSGSNVWGTILNAQYGNNADHQLTTPEVYIPTDDAVLTFWHWMDIESSWDGGNVKISTDGGSSWSIIEPVGGYPGTAVGLSGEPVFNGYTQTWSMATFEIGAYQGEDVMFKFHFGSDGSVTYQGWYIDDVYVGLPENREYEHPLIRHIADLTPPDYDNTRIIESYALYRMVYGDENNPELWEDVISGIADTTYIDPSWNEVETGLYRYAVRAEYTNNVLSDPAISNWLAKNNSASLTVNITTNVGDIAAGALVELDATEPDPEGNYPHYEGIADETGVCVINGIWMSNYDIEIELFNFMTAEDNIDIYQNTVFDIMLTELAYPPHDAYVELNHAGNAYMSWHSPSGLLESFFDFEDDDGEFTAEAGWEWANGCNAGNAWSGENCWSAWPNAQYPNSANSSLYTPVIEVPSDESQLTFYHWYDIENYFDGGNVKISLDEGATWQLITPVGGYPEDAASTSNSGIPGEPCYSNNSSGWVMATFDLSQFDGEDVMFRFHFGSDSSVVYSGWDIDDVYIGEPEDRSIKLSLAAKIGQDVKRHERALEGYAIFRGFADDEENYENWDLVEDGIQDTVYEDVTWQQITEPGTYEYCIRAMYTNGVLSAPTFTNELGFNMYAPVTINVVTNSGDSANGAQVVLSSVDEQHIYEAVVTNNMVVLPEVWKTVYNLSITLAGYENYEQTNIQITDATTLNAELLELIAPPSNLNVDETTGLFTWSEPQFNEYEVLLEEGFETWPPAGWTFVDADDDGYGWDDGAALGLDAYEGTGLAYSASYLNPPGPGALSPDNWLITPPVQMDYDGQINYFVCAQDATWPSEHYGVYVSTTGTDPADFTLLFEETMTARSESKIVRSHPKGSRDPGEWYERTVAIDGYTGQIYLAFRHFNVTDMFYLDLDEVTISQGEIPTRHLDYYNVYVDNNLVGQTTQTEFDLASLDIFANEVEYQAGVSAHFTSGIESDIAQLDFVCHWMPNDADLDVILGVNAMGDNYPNPFNPTTNFSYSIKDDGMVYIEIYNLKGQKVRTLVDEYQTAGIYRLTWTGENDQNKKVSSGLYFYKIRTGDFTTTKKMVLMK